MILGWETTTILYLLTATLKLKSFVAGEMISSNKWSLFLLSTSTTTIEPKHFIKRTYGC